MVSGNRDEWRGCSKKAESVSGILIHALEVHANPEGSFLEIRFHVNIPIHRVNIPGVGHQAKQYGFWIDASLVLEGQLTWLSITTPVLNLEIYKFSIVESRIFILRPVCICGIVPENCLDTCEGTNLSQRYLYLLGVTTIPGTMIEMEFLVVDVRRSST